MSRLEYLATDCQLQAARSNTLRQGIFFKSEGALFQLEVGLARMESSSLQTMSGELRSDSLPCSR
jgi:hypothetical protein